MSYVVQVVGPSGMVTYLKQGREVQRREAARWYPHPSNAQKAIEDYQKKVVGQDIIFFIEPAIEEGP